MQDGGEGEESGGEVWDEWSRGPKGYMSPSVGVAFRLSWPGLEWEDITERVLRSAEKMARGGEREN